MLKHLQDWIAHSGGQAPVHIGFAGGTKVYQYIMIAVDSLGVVVTNPGAENSPIAMPWTAILTIMPDR